MCMCMYLNKSDLKTVCLRIAYSYRLTDFITRKKIKRNASTWNQRFIEMRQHTVCDVECVGHVRRSFVLFVRQADVCICHVSTRWRKSIFIEFCNRKTLQNCYLMTHCMWWLIQSRFEAVLTSMAIRLSVFFGFVTYLFRENGNVFVERLRGANVTASHAWFSWRACRQLTFLEYQC